MADLSQGQSASVVLGAGETVRVTAAGTTTVRGAYGAPSSTTTLTANFQDFGPYGVPAKLEVVAVSGGCSYVAVQGQAVMLTPAEVASGLKGLVGTAQENAALRAMAGGTATLTASRALADSDSNRLLVYAGASNIVLTVNSGLAANFNCAVLQAGSGTVSVVAGTASVSGTGFTAGQDTSLTLVAVGTDSYRILAPYDVRPRYGFLSTALGPAPYGIATSGTVTGSSAGNLALGTALPETYTEGIWLYLPAAAFSSALVGWYYCVMSSTTVGTVYTDATATTIVAGSGVGYAGVTTAVTFPAPITPDIPAGSIGANGGLLFKGNISLTNNANAKTATLTVGGTAITSAASLASVSVIPISKEWRNQGAVNIQRTSGTSTFSTSAGATAMQRNSVKTEAAVTVALSATRGTATDNFVLNWFGYDYV